MYREMIEAFFKNNQGDQFVAWLVSIQDAEKQLIGLNEFIDYLKQDYKDYPSPEKLEKFRLIYSQIKKLNQKIKLRIDLASETNFYKQEYKKLQLEMQKMREINPNLFDD